MTYSGFPVESFRSMMESKDKGYFTCYDKLDVFLYDIFESQSLHGICVLSLSQTTISLCIKISIMPLGSLFGSGGRCSIREEPQVHRLGEDIMRITQPSN